MSAEAFRQRVGVIVEGRTSFTINTADEAKLVLKDIVFLQKELRQIKKEIALEMKEIRAQYADQKEDVSKQGFGKGVMQGIFGKKSVARMDASQKDRIRQTQQRQLQPYETLTQHIDRVLIEYDRIKMQAQAWKDERAE